MRLRSAALPALFLLVLMAPACSNDDALVMADASMDAGASSAAKQLMVTQARVLVAAVRAIQAAAPTTAWSTAQDPAVVASMRATWQQAHTAYQWVQGIAALHFPDLDAALDARYDQALVAGPDPDFFDAQGFVGLHAVERILWADSIPGNVSAFESTFPGYAPAAFPATDAQAAEMQSELCGRLVTDASTLEARIAALALDSPTAYAATIHLMTEQVTKVDEDGMGKDESRYSGTTLDDMRADVAAAEATHAAFHGWLLTKQGGSAVDASIAAGFSLLEQAYSAVQSEGLPPAPVGWSSADPTPTALASPFGALFQATSVASDATVQGSLAGAMGAAVTLLGISAAVPDAGVDAGASVNPVSPIADPD